LSLADFCPPTDSLIVQSRDRLTCQNEDRRGPVRRRRCKKLHLFYFMALRKNGPRKKDLHLFYIRDFDTVEIPSAMIANRMNQQI
jgi:hypothetical protein